MQKLDERNTRLQKLNNLKKQGINSYPNKFERAHSLKEAKDSPADTEVRVAGRLMLIRDMGKICFAHMQDESAKMQIVFKIGDLEKDLYKLFIKNFDIGDFVGIKGKIFTTRKGEISIMVEDFTMLAKALLPLPEKWHGIKDDEERLRKRYLDILFNPEIKEMVKKRAIFWNAVRDFHIQNGFLEVHTPILENTAGGADAKPFITHHNALDMDVYLRISAGELWQKRLMAAGLEKTFEIGRVFRNEGVSTEHLQDYMQCETYWAYHNYEDMYKLMRDCYRYVIKKTFGTLKFKIRSFNIDFNKDWPLLDYSKTIKNKTGIDIWDDNENKMKNKLAELKIKADAGNKARMVDALWKYCRKSIAGPAILINEPKFTSPLAKSSPANPKITERFHFIIAGSEVGNGYSELNDPIDQRERFDKQQKLRDAGDEEAQMADYEFVEALEYGMPPTAGFGFSARLFSFLVNKPIKECQIFPLMKPKVKDK